MLLRTLFRRERFIMRDRKSLEVQVRSLRSSVSFWGPDESFNDAVEVQKKTVAAPKISVDISPLPFDTHLMINQLQQLGKDLVIRLNEGLVLILYGQSPPIFILKVPTIKTIMLKRGGARLHGTNAE